MRRKKTVTRKIKSEWEKSYHALKRSFYIKELNYQDQINYLQNSDSIAHIIRDSQKLGFHRDQIEFLLLKMPDRDLRRILKNGRK